MKEPAGMPGLKELRENLRLSDTAERGQYLQLFLTSFAALYVEIMLIRWVGTEFRLFAYFQNLTLIACFLGFGYGCFRATKRPVQLFDYVALCAIVILIEIPWRGWAGILEVMGAGLSLSPDVSIWHDVAGQVSWAGFAVSSMFVTGILLLLIATMIPLGSLEAGAIAHWLGTPFAFAFGAIICAISALITLFVIRRRDDAAAARPD